jgi:hypothetical protein
MQKQNNFKYIYKGEEVSKEQFNTLAKNGFKWFNDNSINAVAFDSISNFFDGDFKSQVRINDHLKEMLQSSLKEAKNEFYITPPSKGNLDKMCENFEQRVKNNSNECGDISYIVPECKAKIGKKETVGKTDYSEINLEILDLMAKRFTDNKHKYPQGNMKKSIDIKGLEWALFRHVKKMIQPIETDEENYKDHLSAILCNASMILDQLNYNPPNVP